MKVLVIGQNGIGLMPTTPRKARMLLKSRKAGMRQIGRLNGMGRTRSRLRVSGYMRQSGLLGLGRMGIFPVAQGAAHM